MDTVAGVPTVMPSSSRSMKVTALTKLPGFTMATPMLRLIVGMTSTNIEASVVMGSGMIPAWDCTRRRVTMPKVKVAVGELELAWGVIITYTELIGSCMDYVSGTHASVYRRS